MNLTIKKRRFELLGLLVIFLTAFLVRIVNLANLPDGFQGDEAAFGYNAFSILKEGTDEYGSRLPLYFESFGDYKYPGYVYTSVPFVLLFGLNEFSSRFASALAGSVAVFLIYFLIQELTESKKLSLLSGIMIAVSPWHIFFSRGAFESNLGLTYALASIVFYIKLLKNANYKTALISFLFYLLCIFTYSSYRITLPSVIFCITLSWWFLSKNHKNHLKVKLPWLVTAVTLLFLVSFLSFIPKESRARAEGLISGSPLFLNVDQVSLEREDGLARPGEVFFTRFFHNKVADFGLNYIGKYLDHFNPDFLFINGDKTRQIYNIPNAGLLYVFEIPLLLLGLIYLFNTYRAVFFIALSWVVLGIVPSALTNEPPSSVRTLMSIPGYVFLSGAGAYYLLETVKKVKKNYLRNIFFAGISLVILVNLGYVFHQFVIHQPYHRPWSRQAGLKEVVAETNLLEEKYDAVVFPKNPYIFFLFYNRILPSQYLADVKLSEKQVGKWDRVIGLGKKVFRMPYDCPKNGKLNVLYVCSGVEIPQNSKLIHLVRYKDLTPAYSFIEFYSTESAKLKQQSLPEGLNYMVDFDQKYQGVLPKEDPGFW